MLKQGDHLRHYEILEPIGAGGMGEVYQATDTKLERDVVVAVTAGSTLTAGMPETLFEIPNLRHFDVSPDAETFVVVSANATPITRLNVVLNWLDELDERGAE